MCRVLPMTDRVSCNEQRTGSTCRLSSDEPPCTVQAICANPVRGVGTIPAGKILAKMPDTEKEFLNDLFEAKLKYVTTRLYWNEPQANRNCTRDVQRLSRMDHEGNHDSAEL